MQHLTNNDHQGVFRSGCATYRVTNSRVDEVCRNIQQGMVFIASVVVLLLSAL